MAFIIPRGWTRKDGFPQIQGNVEGATLVDEFYCDYDLTDIFLKLPKPNSAYDSSNISPALSQLLLSSYSITPTGSKNHAFVSLQYQPSDAKTAPDEYVEEYFLENGTLEKALETHVNYLTKWNYDLYEFISVTSEPSATPAWWDTAIDRTNATGKALENEYCWDKDKPSGGYNDGSTVWDWTKVKERLKPGVESYIIPSPVVQERIYYSSKKSANTAGNTTGTILTPDETFGVSGGEWLVMSASVQKAGRRYLVERSFQRAKDWDEDFYIE